jgi:hypothetical protein
MKEAWVPGAGQYHGWVHLFLDRRVWLSLTGGAHASTETELLACGLNVPEVHHEILHPLGSTTSDGDQLRRLEMGAFLLVSAILLSL